ncbi:peptidylprolyl isomerase [Paenibacillus sp. 481]|uniref:peptidylprolyl isomerase n=1 Tax=Paenibacillus sp. 481 TaxID=2835869 RepID=UPI001E28D5F8|nr:peptidylprolyl isomerase [Paenibacillus sp. 481]UHA73066.1 peptidylprolyl isomerase [Paenibacillus sp. 481]
MKRMMKRSSMLLLLTIIAVSLLSACGDKPQAEQTPGGAVANEQGKTGSSTEQPSSNSKDSSSKPTKSWSEPPKMVIDPTKNYVAKVKTNKGEFSIELFAKEQPQTVNNFVFLANEKFYDGVTFHRIIESFMVQTGDPLGTGAGGPGYTIKDEYNVKRSYEPGVVAMARTMAPDSAGSQFFICTGADAAGLDQNPTYAIFGKIKDGMDIVTSIAKTPVESNPDTGEVSKPASEIKIESVTIETT